MKGIFNFSYTEILPKYDLESVKSFIESNYSSKLKLNEIKIEKLKDCYCANISSNIKEILCNSKLEEIPFMRTKSSKVIKSSKSY